jgi:hypothetical protein
MERLKVNLSNELDLGTCCMHWRIRVHTSPSYATSRSRDGPRFKKNFRYSQRREEIICPFFLSCLLDLHLKKGIRRGLGPFDRFPSSILSPNYSHIAKKPTREYSIL